MDYQFGIIYDCVTTESDVSHQFEFYYLQRLSCINKFGSLRNKRGLKINFEIGMFSTA